MSLLAFTFGFNLWAAQPGKSIDIIDPAWGKFTIRVEDAGQPAADPIRVELTLLCRDQRTKPAGISPKMEELIDHDKVCAFDTYKFDREKKILSVLVTASEEAKCQKHIQKDFDLKKLCANWTPSGKAHKK